MRATTAESTVESRVGRLFKAGDASSYDPLAADFHRLTCLYGAGPAHWLLELAELETGARVLDIGTGTGILALAGRERGIDVLGLDLSLGMLAHARKVLGDSAPLVAADAESLGAMGDATCDAALSLFALLHLPRPDLALASLRRVLRPGARLVVAVGSGPPRWSRVGLVDAATRLRAHAEVLAGRRLEAPAALDRLVLRHCAARGSDDETPLARRHRNRSRVVPRLVRAAGFHDVRVHWRGWNVEIPSVDDFFALQATFSSTARKRLGAASVSRREAVRQSFDHLCRRVRERGGRFYYPHAALAITARR